MQQAFGDSLETLAERLATTPGRLLATLESEGFRRESARMSAQVRDATRRNTLGAQLAAADFLRQLITCTDTPTKELLGLGDLCLNVLKNSDLLKDEAAAEAVGEPELAVVLSSIERALDQKQAEELNVDEEVMTDESRD